MHPEANTSQHTDITETHTYIKTHLPGVWDTWLPQLSALPHRWDVMETKLQQEELVCDLNGLGQDANALHYLLSCYTYATNQIFTFIHSESLKT